MQKFGAEKLVQFIGFQLLIISGMVSLNILSFLVLLLFLTR